MEGRLVVISFKLDPALKTTLDKVVEYCRSNGGPFYSKSDLIRAALECFLSDVYGVWEKGKGGVNEN